MSGVQQDGSGRTFEDPRPVPPLGWCAECIRSGVWLRAAAMWKGTSLCAQCLAGEAGVHLHPARQHGRCAGGVPRSTGVDGRIAERHQAQHSRSRLLTLIRQWNVRVRGEPWPKLVTGEVVKVEPEFVSFVDQDGEVVLFVRRDELLSVERYVEPPF